MTKVSKIVLASIAACICLEGCVPPPNGGRVTGTELRDLFSSEQQVSKKPETNLVKPMQKNVATIVSEINNGGDIDSIIESNIATLSSTAAFNTVSDEFGNEKKEKTCASIYLLKNITDINRAEETLLSTMVNLIKNNNYEDAQIPTSNEYLIGTRASLRIQNLIRQGKIPSTITFTANELEIVGKEFKSSYNVSDILANILLYIYPKEREDETAKMRTLLLTIFLVNDQTQTQPLLCNSTTGFSEVSVSFPILKNILLKKDKTSLKFLSKIISRDFESATQILLNNPKIKDSFEHYSKLAKK